MIGDVVAQVLSDLLGSVTGGRIGARWTRRKEREQAADRRTRDRALLSVRAVDGEIGRLSRSWLSGEWTVAEGRLRLASVDLAVVSVGDDVRSPGFREALAVDADAEIVTALCPTGRIEIAGPPDVVDWVRERLSGRG